MDSSIKGLQVPLRRRRTLESKDIGSCVQTTTLLMDSSIKGLQVPLAGTLRRRRTLETKDVGSRVNDRHHQATDAKEEGEVGRNFHGEKSETCSKQVQVS
jgi:hypothetical protein